MLESKETPSHLNRVLKSKDELIGKNCRNGKIAFETDAVTGATYTAKGIVDTLNLAGKRFNAFIAGGQLQLSDFPATTTPSPPAVPPQREPADIVQAHVVLTVAEGKRLIALGVPRMPIMQEALRSGMVIVTKGTTNTYIAEELLGRPVAHGSFVFGRVLPETGGSDWPAVEPEPEIILINGKQDTSLTLTDALRLLRPGDVVIKGANALDYERRQAGILVGGGSSGTVGAAWSRIVGHRAHMVIPVGLEKQISAPVLETSIRMREPIEQLTSGPSLFFVTGHIVTELEALTLLTGVDAFQGAAGGVGGAEGSSWIVLRGTRKQVTEAIELVSKIQGEPLFLSAP